MVSPPPQDSDPRPGSPPSREPREPAEGALSSGEAPSRALPREISAIFERLRARLRGGDDAEREESQTRDRLEACERALSAFAERLIRAEEDGDGAQPDGDTGAERLLEALEALGRNGCDGRDADEGDEGATASAPGDSAPPPQPEGNGAPLERLGDYELLEVLGRGGMGIVHRARQVSLGREVALKLIRPELVRSVRVRERFAREAKAAAAIRHPSIVQVHEAQVDGERPHIVMELVRGVSLEDVVRERGPLPAERALGIIREVAEGVAAAHAAGVLHRDIKPGNILVEGNLESARTRGRARLADFGLAQLATDETLTRTGDILGSVPFMAPEQVQGREAEEATDVYGLGATLYALLTGRPPHAGSSAAALADRVARRDPIPIRTLSPQVDRDTATICQKAMRWQPSARYGSAAELARDIERRLRHEPIGARPASWVYRAGLAVRRNPRAALGTLGTALGAVVVALVVLGWLRYDGLRSVEEHLKGARLDGARAQLDGLLSFPPLWGQWESELRVKTLRRRGELGAAVAEAQELPADARPTAYTEILAATRAELGGWRKLLGAGLRWTFLAGARNALDGVDGLSRVVAQEEFPLEDVADDAALAALRALWSLELKDPALAFKDLLDQERASAEGPSVARLRDALGRILEDRAMGQEGSRPPGWRDPSGRLVDVLLRDGAGERRGLLDPSARATLSLLDLYLPKLPAPERLSILERLGGIASLEPLGPPLLLEAMDPVVMLAHGHVSTGPLPGDPVPVVALVTRERVAFLEVRANGLVRQVSFDYGFPGSLGGGHGLRAAALIDVDGKPGDELIVGEYLQDMPPPVVTRVLTRDARSGTWRELTAVHHGPSRHETTSRTFAVGDVDGDEKIDLVIGFTSGGSEQRRVCLVRDVLGRGEVRQGEILPDGSTPEASQEADIHSVLVVDLDGDGHPEICAATGPWHGRDLRFWRVHAKSVEGPFRLGPLGTFRPAAAVRLEPGGPGAVLAVKSAYLSRDQAAFPPEEPLGLPEGLYLFGLDPERAHGGPARLEDLPGLLQPKRKPSDLARSIFPWSDTSAISADTGPRMGLDLATLEGPDGLLEAAAVSWALTGYSRLAEAKVDLYRVERGSGAARLVGDRIYAGRPGLEARVELVHLPDLAKGPPGAPSSNQRPGLVLLEQDAFGPRGLGNRRREMRLFGLDRETLGPAEDAALLVEIAETYRAQCRPERVRDVALEILGRHQLAPEPTLMHVRELLLDALLFLGDLDEAGRQLTAGNLPAEARTEIASASRLAEAKPVALHLDPGAPIDASFPPIPPGGKGAGVPPVPPVPLGGLDPAALRQIQLDLDVEVDVLSWDRSVLVGLFPRNRAGAEPLRALHGIQICTTGGVSDLLRGATVVWGGWSPPYEGIEIHMLDAAGFRKATGAAGGRPRYHVRLRGPVRGRFLLEATELKPHAVDAEGRPLVQAIHRCVLSEQNRVASHNDPSREPFLPLPPGPWQLGILDSYADTTPQENDDTRGPAHVILENVQLRWIP